jgi:exodeoxyribonuclease-3
VLCLQETKTEDARFRRKEFEEAGGNVVYRVGKSYNGVAIVSAGRPTVVSLGLDVRRPRRRGTVLIRAVFSGSPW